MRVIPGAHDDSFEAGDVSRGRLSDVIEAEAGFCAHRGVGSYYHFGRGAGAGDNKVVSNTVELVIFSVILRVDLYVVTIVNLLLDVFVHLCGDFGLVRDLVVQGMDSLGGAVIVFTEVG